MLRISGNPTQPATVQHQQQEDSQEPVNQQLQETLFERSKEASVQSSQPTSPQEIQPTPSQHSHQSPSLHSQPQLHGEAQSEPQPLDFSCSALSSASTTARASKRRRTTESTAAEYDVSGGSSSEPELQLSPPVLPPKEKRGRRGKRTASRTEQEFSSLMIELVTLRNAHSVTENDVQEGCSSAIHTQRRALSLRVQGMGLANDNLAANTKEQYITYLRLFRDFCDKTYAYENDLRYEVSEDKVLVFFKDVMFERKAAKVFRPGDTKDVRMAVALVPPETNAVRRVVDLRSFLEKVEPEADNTKILYGLCEGATMDQALKALVHLQNRQINRFDNPSRAPPLRRSRAIKEILAKYCNDLVFGELVNHRNWSASCAVRNTYSIDEHLRCLLDCWQQPVSASSPSAKLHLSLAIRHAMMLRDEDLRGVSYSDIFIDPATNVIGGTQNLVYLMFAFHRGKTNRTGKLLYGTSVRHSDVRRCGIGALGFYFYDLFHVKNEPPPNFDDPTWVNTKLLHSWPNITEEVSYESQRDATGACFQRQRISCRHITHSGRHSGASEAKLLRIRREDIRKAGRWIQNTSKMDAFYDDDPSYSFGLEMAGFLGGKVPFHLKRNEVSPSLELQRLIFPFIETACGPPGSPGYHEWQKECVHEMEERNANDPSQLSTTMPLQYDPNVRGFVPNHTRQSDLAKKCFLKALIRLRRVILQDAGEYLSRFKCVRSPLLETGVFTTPMFKTFKDQIEAALDTKDVALPTDMHPKVKLVLQDQQRIMVRQGEIMRRVPGDLESMGHELQRLRIDSAANLDRAMMYLDAKFDYGMNYTQDHILRLESNLDYLQSKLDYLISRMGAPAPWQPPGAPLFGYNASAGVPTFQYHQFEQPRSTAGPSEPCPRRLAPVSAITSTPPKWCPVAPPQLAIQGPMPAPNQPSMIMKTTATTTTTTATTTTSLTIDSGFTVNYRLGSVQAVCAEVQKYDQEVGKPGAAGIARKHQKQISNKRLIVKEVEHLTAQHREKDVNVSQEDAFQKAMSQLDLLMKVNSWSVNQLVVHCRKVKADRDAAVAATAVEKTA